MKVILYNFTWRNVVSSVLYDVRSEFCSKDKYHNWLYGKPWIDIDSSTSSTPILLLTDIRIQSGTPGDRLSQSSLVWRCGGASTPLSAGPHLHCSALYNCGQRKQWNIGFVDGFISTFPLEDILCMRRYLQNVLFLLCWRCIFCSIVSRTQYHTNVT